MRLINENRTEYRTLCRENHMQNYTIRTEMRVGNTEQHEAVNLREEKNDFEIVTNRRN